MKKVETTILLVVFFLLIKILIKRVLKMIVMKNFKILSRQHFWWSLFKRQLLEAYLGLGQTSVMELLFHKNVQS